MKKYIIIFSALVLILLAYFWIPALTKHEQNSEIGKVTKMLPRVLILTTGSEQGNGELSQGVIVAIQSFNKHGAFVWLDNRNILLKPEELSKFSIIIVTTSIGYHDGDRKYSLTYLSDPEMDNIINWVKEGGTLVAEENVGRNRIDGVDRVSATGELNPDNWKLSQLFGIKMTERDMAGYSIEEKGVNIWNGNIKRTLNEDEWVLIPSELISTNIKVLAEWENGIDKIPAIIQNYFGQGTAVLLSSTYLLHPSNNGGISSIEQIEKFYEYVLNINSGGKSAYSELNPWPNGYSTAFCISFNCSKKDVNYENILSFLKNEKLNATFFVGSDLSKELVDSLSEIKNVNIQSYMNSNIKSESFSEISHRILINESVFKRSFTGMRIPDKNSGFWGLLFQNDNGYIFDSSIGVDQLSEFSGSVFPYNISVSKDAYIRSMNLLEICPAEKDDKNFYRIPESEKAYTEELQKTDSQIFEKYLLDFYHYVVFKNNGLLVYQGRPEYTGYNENTLLPLKILVDTIRVNNSWITTLEEAAEFRNQLKDVIVISEETENTIKFKFILPGQKSISGISFKLRSKPASVQSENKYVIEEINGIFYLITDAKNNDEFVLTIK